MASRGTYALGWIIILSAVSAVLIAYFFINNTLNSVDPDYAILGICLNVSIAFTAVITLIVRKSYCDRECNIKPTIETKK